MGNEVPYLASIGHKSRWSEAGSIGRIAEAIAADGTWQEVDEWRISTETTYRIEPEQAWGKDWFRVSAQCDYEMACHTPTLERAVEMLGVFDSLIMDLFWTRGWASWAAKGRVEANDDEILPPTT